MDSVTSASHLGSEVCLRNKELLLKAQLSIPCMSQLELHRVQVSALAAAAQRVRMAQHQNQLIDRESIVNALQRRHLPAMAETTAAHAELRFRNSFVRKSPIPSDQPTTEPQSSATAPSLRTTHASQEGVDDQNAPQLNPSAFQFPWKLHDMLDRSKIDGNEQVVSWVDNGEAFRVHLPDVFVESIMPRFFKQTKYKSFQRQLNLYGFTRLHNGPNKGGYKHKYFRQGQRTMCQLIMRCPIRDSSSASKWTTADVQASKEVRERNHETNIAERTSSCDNIKKDNAGRDVSSGARSNARMTPPSSISITPNKMSSSSLTIIQQQQLEQSDGLPRNPQHHSQHIMPATRQASLVKAIEMMRWQEEEEQKLRQLRAQQLETHQRLQQIQREQESIANALVPVMSLVGTDHTSVVSRKVSLPTTAMEGHSASVTVGNKSVDSTEVMLDTSNNAGTVDSQVVSDEVDVEMKDNCNANACVPASPGSVSSIKSLHGNDKNSMVFPKEFQFPWKLYEMLQRSDENNFSHLVSWMPGDSCFKVHDVDSFVKSVMPSFFKQTKYKSFQRQLNLYGFIRIDTGPNKGGYRHPNFVKGRKDLLTSIIRIKIKGNGKARSVKGGAIPASNLLDVSNSENDHTEVKYDIMATSQSSNTKEAAPTSSIPSSPGTNSAKTSGIDVILEAIKARERKDCEQSGLVQKRLDRLNEVVDTSSSDSNTSSSPIPSTIDIRTKDAMDAMDAKNAYGLSWRQNPSESYSDWTIEILSDDASLPQTERSVYHVHRRVLAVGPKKSEYFANIFKLNGAANRNQLRLSKDQAAVFPQVLDYIYADIDFDMDAEKAYTLYCLGERIENESILQIVAEYYSKCCMNKDNIVHFIKLGQGLENKTLFEAAVLKCSQEIWSMDVEIAGNIDPGILYQVLILVMTQDQDTPKCNSVRLSRIVANCVSNATRMTLTPEIFRSLTDASLVPTVGPVAAIKLLATENTLLNAIRGSPSAGDPSLHERCTSAIHESWDTLRQHLSENSELANTMRSISSIVLFDILMKRTNRDNNMM